MININKKGRTSGQGTSAAGATGANNSAAAPAPIPPPAALVMPTMIGKGKSPKADDDVAGKELIVSPRPFRRPTASTLQIVETTDADVVELEHQLQRLSSDERKKNEEKIKAGPVDMTVRGWSQGRSGASNSGAIVSLSRTSSVSSPFQAWEWQEAGPSNGQQPAQQGDNIIPQAQLVPYLPPQDNEEELEEDGDDDVKPAAYMR
ncbi:g12693 [Coccomyxa viridis]|uniref:G12693 protein n=1 Tax=Coccomyxa viridis TaxID=1274662 RepID=A0ABP1GB05_9CHLO